MNNQSFTFTNGAVFNAALINVSTTLSFTDNATSFTLSSSGGTATGTNRFDSCVLTVITSTYGSGAGPQVGEVITLDPCDFDSENKTTDGLEHGPHGDLDGCYALHPRGKRECQ